MRRNRKASWSRRLVRENVLLSSDLILPIFVQEGKNKRSLIPSMQDVECVSIDIAKNIAKEAARLGISAIALFPYIEISKRCDKGLEALNADNLICRAIKEIKGLSLDIGVMTDVALDPYTIHGHDGLVDSNGYVVNDLTLEILSIQALNFATAGCDIVAPSDMMDGRIGAIRATLESEGFHNTQIMSYTAKYASNFYGPFRDAVGSASYLGTADKKTYQMDFANSAEALNAMQLDIDDGADFIIVKPGMHYLDIIRMAKDNFNIPTVAYQVSGEYAMLKIASKSGIFDFLDACLEVLIAMKRAGASAVISYAALEIAKAIN